MTSRTLAITDLGGVLLPVLFFYPIPRFQTDEIHDLPHVSPWYDTTQSCRLLAVLIGQYTNLWTFTTLGTVHPVEAVPFCEILVTIHRITQYTGVKTSHTYDK